MDWSENAIVFKIDGQTLKTISPPNGFWEYGEFDNEAPGSENPWQNSPNKMTPFDQEVSRASILDLLEFRFYVHVEIC